MEGDTTQVKTLPMLIDSFPTPCLARLFSNAGFSCRRQRCHAVKIMLPLCRGQAHFSSVHDIMNIRAPMSLTIQSTPCASPSPVTALQATMLQCRLANCLDSRPRVSAISAAPSAPARSCLFANTSKEAPANFYARCSTHDQAQMQR